MKTRKNDADPAEAADLAQETQLPGLSELREVVENYRPRWLPSSARLRKDSIAGLTVAVASVPEGMAGGIWNMW